MNITKMIPRYCVEGFGTISIDEDCSWMEEDQYYAVCFIIDIPNPIKIEDSASFYFDTIDRIEKELKLMPGALRYALFIYQLENSLELEYLDPA